MATKMTHIWMRGAVGGGWSDERKITAKFPVALVERLWEAKRTGDEDEEEAIYQEIEGKMDEDAADMFIMCLGHRHDRAAKMLKLFEDGRYLVDGEDDITAVFARTKAIAIAGFKKECVEESDEAEYEW